MRLISLLFILLITISLAAQNALPEITNLTVNFDETSETLTVSYDLSDAENDPMDIHLLVSENDGLSYLLNTANATGDVGTAIAPGNGKNITWEAAGLLGGSGNYKVKVVADDLFQLDIQDIVNQVDSNRILANLQFIEGVRHRTAAPTHLEAIKDSIEQRFVAANLSTRREDFLFGNYTGQNIIGSLEGTRHSDSTYIIDGHFDTVSNSPGADDNGSAVAGMLEAMRVLAPYQYNKTLRFIGFDLEEVGLLGAYNYTAEDIPAEEIIKGVFNLEMIGYFTNQPNTQQFPPGFEVLYPDVQAELAADQFRGNFITNVGDINSIPLQTAYNDAADQYVPGLKVISITAPNSWDVLTPDLGRSDHAAFWVTDRPALMLTDGSNFRNPHYHSPNDVISTLDFTFMENVVKAVVGAIAEEAGIQHSTFETASFSILSSIKDPLDCEVSLFPVPFNDNLDLRFGNCAFDNLNVQIFDVLGKLVRTTTIQPTFSATTKLNLEELESGLYLLRISHGEESLSRKILKN